MARGTATITRAIGLALLVGGIGLGVWGYQMSESVGSKIKHTFTGSYSDEVMARFIGGAVGCVVGLYLLAKK